MFFLQTLVQLIILPKKYLINHSIFIQEVLLLIQQACTLKKKKTINQYNKYEILGIFNFQKSYQINQRNQIFNLLTNYKI